MKLKSGLIELDIDHLDIEFDQMNIKDVNLYLQELKLTKMLLTKARSKALEISDILQARKRELLDINTKELD